MGACKGSAQAPRSPLARAPSGAGCLDNRAQQTSSHRASKKMASNVEASLKSIEDTKRLIRPLISSNGQISKYQQLLETKQLAKPNFKLIQDLVKSLIVESRVLRDLFNPQDFDAKLAKDRQHRLKFIQRLIEFTAQNEQPVVGCLAAKIVSGQEAIKALELLQALAKVTQVRLAERSQRKPATFVRASRTLAGRPVAAAKRTEAPKTGSRAASSASTKTGTKQPAETSSPERQVAGDVNVGHGALVPPDRPKRSPAPIEPLNHEPAQRPITISVSAVTIPQRPVPLLVKESEIEQNIQQVRANLRTLRVLALELGKAKEELYERMDLISRKTALSKTNAQ